MKTKKETSNSVVRNKYSAQFKEQALERADRDSSFSITDSGQYI